MDGSGREVANVIIQPATLQVVVPITSYLAEKTVPVRPSVVGQPAPGYSVRLDAEPRTVILCCSSEAVESTEFVNVVPVPIGGATSTIITQTQIILPPGVDLVPGQSNVVTVTVEINELQSAIDLSIAPTVQGVSSDFSIFVNPELVDVTLEGSFNRLQAITPANVRLIADVTGLGAGSHTVALRTILPEGVTLQNMSVDEVTVTLIAPTPVPPTATPLPSATPTQQPTVAPTATVAVVAPVATVTQTTAATATATRTAIPTPSSTATASAPTATATATATPTNEPPAAQDVVPPEPSPSPSVIP